MVLYVVLAICVALPYNVRRWTRDGRLDLKGKTEQKNHFIRRLRLVIPIRLVVKCGIAACGMRRLKCGMECAESYSGTVGNNVLTIRCLTLCAMLVYSDRVNMHTVAHYSLYAACYTVVCPSLFPVLPFVV